MPPLRPDQLGPLWGLTLEQAQRLQRIEQKLDMLLEALADHSEEPEEQNVTLDGTYAGVERAKGQSLG